MISKLFSARAMTLLCQAGAVAVTLGTASPAQAQVTALKQAVAEAASRDRQLAAFYRERDFAPIFTAEGEEGLARRRALLAAMEMAPAHALPAGQYNANRLMALLKSGAANPREMGFLDVELTRLYLDFAVDVQTGILTPSKVNSEIVRKVPLRDKSQYLHGITSADPVGFVRALPPANAEYVRLVKTRMEMQRALDMGGYGPAVPAKALEPGDRGRAVVALRDRLHTMGYMGRSASAEYDGALQKAVQAFQIDHGLADDGVAGGATMREINTPLEQRLKSITVAMERERWLNRTRGDRHVLVNLTDFSARIVDFDRVTFQTRAVIGSKQSGRRTPEFSDVMEHMIINPTWNVPRSITVKEYLPLLRQNPHAVSHLRVVDSRGRTVPRGAVNFAGYNARNFPFDLKQPPSNTNALGLVKFMFPNSNNIYLHDTPAKSLFQREVRAFSHGCIRLADPFDFAYALLAVQEDDPKGLFQSILNTGRETKVDLDTPIQVHLIYRTAFTDAQGRTNFRADIYGRDAQIWEALDAAGVSLHAIRG
ncbi:L,D-transpeptidase family protein [Pseudooceanicola aestuarii]|uniref:L,D-transpeptidase family protein n=1 Tax=Pseudooceanicola aestuarii TaxID=2697319 RepID=UPI0013D0B1B6|nr:L,D-transpeptidase family protein [Pseudooceanicola aestuarii]